MASEMARRLPMVKTANVSEERQIDIALTAFQASGIHLTWPEWMS